MGHVYQSLEVWQKAFDLTLEVYSLLEKFPDIEKYVLVDQIRRSSISVPSNIAEGSGRNTDKEFIQFLFIANGSLCELETQLLLSLKLRYISGIEEILELITQIKKQLNSFINYLKKK